MPPEARAAIGARARAHVLQAYTTARDAGGDARRLPGTGMMKRILVIKLAALGDFVQAFGPFAAIRAHHPGAEITLLTTPPYAELARRSPWFDAVWSDGRPAWTDPPAIWRLARRLRGAGFDPGLRPADLGALLALPLAGRARGRSGPASPRRQPPACQSAARPDAYGRAAAGAAGDGRHPRLPRARRWLAGWRRRGLGLPPRFALLVPGASPGGRASAGRSGVSPRWPPGWTCRWRWSAARRRRRWPPTILAAAPGAVDLTGRTGFAALGAVARRADFAIGNDTGPTHLIAAAGCPTLALFGPESDPALCAPRGRAVAVLQRDSLAGLTVAEARAALAALVAA